VTHGKRHGTGLGLTICKKTLEDHGGRIWARTQPGCGAIFCFSLPLAT
jgi:signal transduction histidine kinase